MTCASFSIHCEGWSLLYASAFHAQDSPELHATGQQDLEHEARVTAEHGMAKQCAQLGIYYDCESASAAGCCLDSCCWIQAVLIDAACYQ